MILSHIAGMLVFYHIPYYFRDSDVASKPSFWSACLELLRTLDGTEADAHPSITSSLSSLLPVYQVVTYLHNIYHSIPVITPHFMKHHSFLHQLFRRALLQPFSDDVAVSFASCIRLLLANMTSRFDEFV